jgi:hypothetical protein
MASTSLSHALLDIYVAPMSLFENLKEINGKTWFPLVLIIAISFTSIVYFYSGMSTDWLIEQQMEQAGDLSISEQAQVRGFLEESAASLGWVAAVSNSIFTLFIMAALAGYFKLISHSKEKYSYSEWFKFVVWMQMPTVIYMLGFMVLVVTASSPDLPIVLINYASLNQILLHLSVGHSHYLWAETVNLFFLWSIALAALGLNRWVKLSVIKSSFIASIPYVTIFVIWALVA